MSRAGVQRSPKRPTSLANGSPARPRLAHAPASRTPACHRASGGLAHARFGLRLRLHASRPAMRVSEARRPDASLPSSAWLLAPPRRRVSADVERLAVDRLEPALVERSNLTFRMQNRRFTWLNNGFSKKLENHAYSVALFVMFYNFARIHKTLQVTPAMTAGVTDRLWDVKDIVMLVEAEEAKVDRKRGSFKKRVGGD